MELRGSRPLPLWDWQKFSEKDRLAAWCELRDWVQHTLVERLHLETHVPTCWQEHPALVDRLVRLHELEASLPGAADLGTWEARVRAEAPRWSACDCRRLPLGA